MLLCTILFLLPGSSFSNSFSFPGLDKVVHFSLFFVFTLLFLSAYAPVALFTYIWVTISILSYIVAIEYIQKTYIPGRGFEMEDILANLTGIIFASILFFKISKKAKVKKQ